jgi:fatty-acyl-CoA synthase
VDLLLATNMGADGRAARRRRPFDVQTILETAAREHANMMTIVGDAYARPMIEELRRETYDLSGLAVLGTGGTPTSFEAKRRLRELLPHVTIRDGYGASEIGVMASGETGADADTPQRFVLTDSARLLSADRSRFLDVGDDEVGWIAGVGTCPSGTSTTKRPRNRPSPSSRAHGSRSRVTARATSRTDRSSCSAATRSW